MYTQNKNQNNQILSHSLFHKKNERTSNGSFLISQNKKIKKKRLFKLSTSIVLIFTIIISGLYFNQNKAQSADLFPLTDSYQSTPITHTNTQSNYQTTAFNSNNYTSVATDDEDFVTTTATSEATDSLLIHADGTNNATSFTDSSGKNKTITATGNARMLTGNPVTPNGNAQISTTQSKFGGASTYFDGTGDYLSVPDSDNWDFGSGDFTIDFWANPSSSSYRAFIARDTSSVYAPFLIGLNGSAIYMTSNGTSWDIASGNLLGGAPINQWTHFAVVRSGNNFYTFKNGVIQDQWTSSLSLLPNSNPLSIAAAQSVSDFNGYLEELRITKGTARWTSNFTPPTSAYSTDTSTKLLLHADGTNASTNFIDSSNIGTKFGTTGAYFDGNGDYLSVPDSSDWDFGSGNFTIDFWLNLGPQSASATGILSTIKYPGAGSWYLYRPANSNNLSLLGASSAGGLVIPNMNQWYHVVFSRASGVFKYFLDGVQVYNTTASINFDGSDASLAIGRFYSDFDGYYFNGYLDELRITKGTARWTSNFTPPTQASSICPSSTTDSDNNTYNVVQIGNQCWTKENMKVGTMLTNGSTLPSNNSQIEKWCYDSNPANCATYGGLYTWAEANQLDPSCNSSSCSVPENNQGICPTGFHVPTDTEYKTLEMSLGMSQAQADATGWRGTDEGTKMKTVSGGTFSGLFAGYRSIGGSFLDLNTNAFFWSASEYSAADSWRRTLGSAYSSVFRGSYSKVIGWSIRCLKNSNPTSPLYASQLYSFDASAYTSPTSLNFSLLAYATANAGNGITTKIWNNSNSTFENLTSLTNTNSSMPTTALTQSITSNIANYIDGTNKVKILVSSTNPSVAGTNAILNTDLIKLSLSGAPSVTTDIATNITSTTATGNGNVTNTNGDNPTVRGIEWGTSTGNYSTGNCDAGTGGSGTYTCNITNLSPSTTYYYRAKTINTNGTAYGSELSFTTPALPVITITNPNTNPAQSKTITASADKGTLTQSITTGNTCDNSLTFSTYQSTTFSNESDNTKKVCYKSDDATSGISYLMSNAISGIDTSNPIITSVTSDCQNITEPNFIITASDINNLATNPYSFDGGSTWQSQNNKTYPAYSKTINANQIKIMDLANNIATYNSDISKDCFISATVTTNSITNPTSVSATGNGNITNTNGENPERLIQWRTNSGSYNETNQCSAGAGGTGTYQCNLTSLTPDTTYYYRAKATNAGGTSYGTELNFTTLPEETTIPNPNPTSIQDAYTNNYISIGTGTLDNTNEVTTNLNLTLTDAIAEVTLPVNTTITNTDSGNINMSQFNISDVTSSTRSTIQTSRGAIEIGIPNTRLTFSNPITISIDVDPLYNGETLAIQSKSYNQSTWTDEGTCTVTNGKCTFTTTHATTYTVNGDGSLRGDTTVNTSLPINATISLSCDDTINLSSITGTGLSTLTSSNEALCTVRTNNSNGYKLEWQASSENLTNTNSDAINPYLPTTPNTPEAWNINQTTSAWGARLKSTSTDNNTTLWGTVDDYTTGKWLNINNTTPFQIITRTTETTQTGSDQIIQFGAEVGSNKFQPSGSYSADVVVTATTL